MSMSPFLPVQSTGLRGRIAGRVFRLQWSIISGVVTPVLLTVVVSTLAFV
jgi:hypothetical protein